ncbi:type 3 dihydrofolate reductase [Shewanella oneidensis MR-1]|uniref:Dihydrofolate reductase n=1 Tax=Shewanella oneidensis (strain ATCC 700550 / JCM 31522 / CIP 106686 / LMG 19005 / NCIMB 14063 / MR-1) TaxID=211586 RepID=Q8EB86_SHEON|nr:type 3 dihydrofolate reductase [Shewanella oneidensis]AAN56632.1 dihydrofolate reductase FolA [Shewanella oneidensis MR-1]MDX5998979.1 type 3 dihydrofolate reductase [Shewanella oneidensis]MEE2027493.1 Dihydrofolate reductase type 3 [Shewanella oneidensis]QKG97992.1 type 3 dihydrofolate reductase [Shewanella oneidensis MR-1]
MRIAMIAAMANNRVIGKDNKMPWHLPEDLRHFKAMTLGKPVVMGRKTFESIGRPLPGRHNIVISRQADLQIEGVTCVTSFEAAKRVAGDCEELVVIGGGQLYKQLLPQADRLYLTQINLDVDGDTFFPAWEDNEWQKTETQPSISADGLEYNFINLVKKC